MAVIRKQDGLPNQLVSTFLLYRSRCRRAHYLVAMGLLVLAAAACSANVESESSGQVTPAETPGIKEAQSPAAPAASQVQPKSIEPAKEEQSSVSIGTDISKPKELPHTEASVAPLVSATEQPTILVLPTESSALSVSPNETVGESVAASSETDNSNETGTSVLPRRLHVGGQARMLDAMQHRSAGVDEADIAKTITIDIRRDEENRYYFEPLVPLEVPAGGDGSSSLSVNSCHSSDCW